MDETVPERAIGRPDRAAEDAAPAPAGRRAEASPGAWFRPRGWRLATRVIVLALSLLAALLAILLVAYGQTAHERRQAEVANAVALGQVVAGGIDIFARDLESTTLAMAGALANDARPITQETVGPYLRALSDEYGMLRGLFVTDLSGRVAAAATGEGIGLDLSSRPYFQTLAAGAPTVWGPGVLGIQSGEVTVTFGRAIRAPDGAPRGYLVAAFYAPRLLDRLQERLPADADVTLVDRRGFVLHSTHLPSLSADQRDMSRVPQIAAALRGETVPVDGRAYVGDDERFGVVAPVPSTGWAVAFTRPLEPLEALLRSRLIAQAGGVTAVVLLTGLALTLATRRIARPLGQLAGAAAAIARGDRADIPESGDAEVGQVAAAMRAMSAAVAEREASLRFLAGASELLARSLDLDVTLQTIADLAVPTLADGCVIDLLTDEIGPRRIATASGGDPAGAALMAELRRYPLDPDNPDHPAVRAIVTRAPVLVPEVKPDNLPSAARDADHLRILQGLQIRSILAAPLLARDRALGTIQLFSATRRYGAADLAIARDLAHRCSLAVENAHLFETVRRSVQARDEFISVAAHELKTPLTSLRGQAQLLLRQIDRRGEVDPDRLRAGLSTIDYQSGKLTRLVAQLLDLSRLETGKLELDRQETDLAGLVTDVARQIQATTDRHNLVVDAPPAWIAWVDGLRLEQVLVNLIDNAIKYSPKGGAIRIALAERPDGHAELSVTDSGVGIASADRERIFERFYRAEVKTYPAGLGLGLYVCRQIVELHGGRIAVEEVPAGGSRFVVTLPIGRPDVAA